MMSTASRFLFALAFVLVLAGCNQNSGTPTRTEEPLPAQTTSVSPPAPAAPTTPQPIPPSTELQIAKVQSVVVSRVSDAPGSLIIHASGSVASSGWTDIKLAPVEGDANGDPRVKMFAFVATSPATPAEVNAPQTVETELRVDDVPPDVRAIRVVSATNAINAPVIQ
jgi:hypothetical protein